MSIIEKPGDFACQPGDSRQGLFSKDILEHNICATCVLSDILTSLSAAFPLRYYYLFHVQEVVFGAGFAGWWKDVVGMLLFLFVPIPGLGRLKSAYIKQNYPKD